MPKPKPRIKNKAMAKLNKARMPSGEAPQTATAAGATIGPSGLPNALEKEIERLREAKKAKKLEREKYIEEDSYYDDDYDEEAEEYEDYDEEIGGSDMDEDEERTYDKYLSKEEIENYLNTGELTDFYLNLMNRAEANNSGNSDYDDGGITGNEREWQSEDDGASQETCPYHIWDNILCGNCVIGTKLLLETEKEPYLVFLTADKPAKNREDEGYFNYLSKIRPVITLLVDDGNRRNLFEPAPQTPINVRFLYIPHETDIIAVLRTEAEYDRVRKAKFAVTSDKELWHIITIPKHLTKSASRLGYSTVNVRRQKESLLAHKTASMDMVNINEHILTHYDWTKDKFSAYKDLLEEFGTSISQQLNI